MPKAAVYEFKEFKETRSGKRRNTVDCNCRAAQIRRDFIWKEVEEFRATTNTPAILDLDLCTETALLELRKRSGVWDMIHSAQVLSGLPTPIARELVQSAASRLTAGGRLLLANVSPRVEVQDCPVCSRPDINFRTELELAELTRSTSEQTLAGQAVFSDDSKLNVYLELHARAAPRS